LLFWRTSFAQRLTQSLRILQRKVQRIYTQQRKELWDQNQIETSFIYSECS